VEVAGVDPAVDDQVDDGVAHLGESQRESVALDRLENLAAHEVRDALEPRRSSTPVPAMPMPAWRCSTVTG
jgi:hypothetical protein